MPTSSRKIVINKGYVGDDSATNESLGLKQISLKEANFGAASDPGSALYETHEEKPHPARRSNGRYLPLFFFACLLSIVAIILSLLSLWGNFGEKCDCSKTEALTTSVEKLSADVIKISSLEENMTRFQRDLIEKEAELNSTRLSLDYLQEEHNNLSEKTKAWLDTIRNDANSTRIQLMASDADAKVALDAVNTTKTLKLNILDAALSQLTTYLKRTNVGVNEVNSTLLEVRRIRIKCHFGMN
ncbi:uncharacterized protein LOC113685321 isoform X1 [Pocillopora damicornis]|uniref:uncharacterized protein LOC113685321 isoform X1 n=1 Tax=Pocillopora damicornis TaxID=46731 RepID=UPI000F54C8FF|nr:uncharacterized protein LOC113685321 isoform X1 [Pocillopora damicornis]